MNRKRTSCFRLLSTVHSPLSTVLCLLSSVFCLLSSDLHAASLTIETQTTVSVSGDVLSVAVTYTNKGNAPAQNLQVHLTLSEQKLSGPIQPHLDPGQSEKAEFKSDLTGAKKGRHPLTVQVDFHDTNQYPFSALSCMTYHYREDANAALAAVGKDLALEKEGALEFAVKNLGEERRDVRATLVLPKEFSASKTRSGLQMEPRSEQKLSYGISNFSAIQGASYPVFCILEYDQGEVHHTQIAKAMVRVVREETWFRRTRMLWMAAAALMAAILLVVVIRSVARSRKQRSEVRGQKP